MRNAWKLNLNHKVHGPDFDCPCCNKFQKRALHGRRNALNQIARARLKRETLAELEVYRYAA